MATHFKPGIVGNALAIPYKPGSAVSPYSVVVVGNRPLVAHVSLEAGELGSLSPYDGTYIAENDLSEPADNAELYWNGDEEQLVDATYVAANSGTYQHFGFMAPGSKEAITGGHRFYAYHSPNGTAITTA